MKSFERQVVNPILTCIKNNQEYLAENLPQLAKLGYLYNTLWYAGRICWGHRGIIRQQGKYGQCEDNPKYKIEMCEPINDRIDCLIYDAWGMHVYNDGTPSWEEFSTIILKGKEFSQYELLLRKPNKTMEEWVEVLTDERYNYCSLYPNRRRVIDNLLCAIGTEYGYKDGYVIREAGGAEQDISIYGEWENATFRKDIQQLVNKIMSYPEVEQTIRTAFEYIKGIRQKEEAARRKLIESLGASYEEWKKVSTKEVEKVSEYHCYYPICEYSNITKFDAHTHPSYIKAAIEICEDILAHAAEEAQKSSNVVFAKNFLNVWKK